MVPSVSAGIAFPVVLVACLVPLGGFLSVALGGRAARVDGWLRKPSGSLAALSFLPDIPAENGRPSIRVVRRVRRRVQGRATA